MFNLIKKFFAKIEKIKIHNKYYKQKYPVQCETKKGKITSCKDCEFKSNKECQCPYPFQVKISSTIEEFVKVDKDYRGISTFTDYLRKIKVANHMKVSRAKKLEAKRKVLEAGAAYLAAMELCKELGLDIKEI